MATLRVPGADIYYEVAGEGVPAVLAHDLALDTRRWDEQVEALSDCAMLIGASKVVIHDAGHTVNMEAPLIVDALVRDVILGIGS